MLFFYIICGFFGILGAYIIARFGHKLGIIDKPNLRSSHSKPTPKGGGIGILLAFIVCALCWKLPLALWISASIVSLISLFGDYRELTFKVRLVIQICSAAVFSGSIFFGRFMSGGSVLLSCLLFLFGVLYITSSANYYNFMDGINGIAGLTGTVAFSFLGLYGLLVGKGLGWSVTAFGIAVACIGFLPLNFPKAKVFMGDVGSVLLGFLFASWVLYFSKSLLEFIVLSSFLFPFYVDELSTLIVRIKDKERLTKAHRRHIYQILANQAGLSHSVVTFFYAFFQIIVGIVAWIGMREGLVLVGGLLFFLFGNCFFGGMYIRRRWEVKE